jgi:putative transposase
LNEHWFQTLHQARTEIATWRRDYNKVRPHSSIGRMPPGQFAEHHRRNAGDAARHPTSTEINYGFASS